MAFRVDPAVPETLPCSAFGTADFDAISPNGPLIRVACTLIGSQHKDSMTRLKAGGSPKTIAAPAVLPDKRCSTNRMEKAIPVNIRAQCPVCRKTTSCCVNKKSRPSVYVYRYTACLDFFTSLHLTIFEGPGNYDLCNSHLCGRVILSGRCSE